MQCVLEVQQSQLFFFFSFGFCILVCLFVCLGLSLTQARRVLALADPRATLPSVLCVHANRSPLRVIRELKQRRF